MNTADRLMQGVCACIRDRQVDWSGELTPTDWEELAALAREQRVLPMVVEGVCRSRAFQSCPEEQKGNLRRISVQQSVGQAVRTDSFLRLYAQLEEAGLRPVVMKGLLCRVLYPKPDSRTSADEDLLVSREQFKDAADFLLSRGFRSTTPDKKAEDTFELGFVREDGLYLELHRTPFSPDGAQGELNRFFEQTAAQGVPYPVGGGTVLGPDPHTHMLYLILHAYKHLIHSGFGIRQVCDILLWAERYGSQIRWEQLREECMQVRGWRFAQTLFDIGIRALEFDREKAGIPQELLKEQTPWQQVLEDLLAGGVYGGQDLTRRHSATVTLGAVDAQREGGRYSLLQTLFPARSRMAGRYPYVEKYPVLLPAAWVQRLLSYGGEVVRGKGESDTSESLRIGKQRTRLLRQLDIID